MAKDVGWAFEIPIRRAGAALADIWRRALLSPMTGQFGLGAIQRGEEYFSILEHYLEYRTRGKQFAVVLACEADARLAREFYASRGRVHTFIHRSLESRETTAASSFYSNSEELINAIQELEIELLFVCNAELDGSSVAMLTDLNGVRLGCELVTHTDVILNVDLLYGTFFSVHMPPKYDRVALLKGFMADKKSTTMKFLEHVDIEGKNVVELGCSVCAMTAQLVKFAPKMLTVVEANMKNLAMFNAYKTALGITNSEILIQDFHKLDVKADVLIAYGVLYHSSHPAALIANLVRVADTLCVGTHVWGEDENTTPMTYEWSGLTIHAQIAAEFNRSSGGLCTHQTYISRDDYVRIFDVLGFDCIHLGQEDLPEGRRYAEWVAVRRGSAASA